MRPAAIPRTSFSSIPTMARLKASFSKALAVDLAKRG
jgi:hypothetical protein